MTKIIKFFGWLAVIAGIILCSTIPLTLFAYPIVPTLGVASLLGGALLIAFARVVELLQQLNTMIAPISRLAVHMERRLQHQNH